MKNKITQFIPVTLVLVVVGFRYFSRWCTGVDQVCFQTIIDRMIPVVTYPLFFFAIFLLPIAIILVFVSQGIFNSWLKFAAWALPLAFIYIAMTPVWDSSFLPFTRDDAARLAGGVFAAISLLIILYRALRPKLGHRVSKF
jgi:nitrogen fixation-related uncharacterized protein